MGNDDAMVGRIYSRRQALRAAMQAGFGLASVGLMQRMAAAGTIPTTQPRLPAVVSPVMTEGPFFVDEKLNRSDLLTGTDRPSVINGMPLLLGMTVYKLENGVCTPMKDAQVDLWHADAIGKYSDESQPLNHEITTGQKWLRGFQMTDDAGAVQFKTIFPGWYATRAIHIHFKIRRMIEGKTADFTSQFFLRQNEVEHIYAQAPYSSTTSERDTNNSNDGTYNGRLADGSRVGDQMLLDLVKSPEGKGYAALFPLILTDASMQPMSGRGRRGPGGPATRGGMFGPPPRP